MPDDLNLAKPAKVSGHSDFGVESAVVARTVCHRHFTGTVQVVVELLDEIAGQGRGEPRLCQKVGHTVRDTRGTSGIHLCEQ